MITIPELAAEALGSRLAEHLDRRFGSTDKGLIELVQSAARLALDCIGNSDALYHNFEHTMLVTLCGYDIVRGRMLRTPTNASDFAHILIACLFHDIGYVRGILKGDSPDGYIIDAKGNKTKLPRGSSDAALLPYHVDRSKLFVMDRIGEIEALDAIRIANATDFGLVAGVWTKDGGRQLRVARALRSGQVFVNNYGAGGGVELPFGGVKHSGHGREKGFEALYGYTVLKTVVLQHG